MVATPTQIVHARGTNYGVCTNSISLYAGKVCGVVRYNPACALRLGMKGYRTLRLQQALNLHGADISEDGEFGEKTQKALKDFQTAQAIKRPARQTLPRSTSSDSTRRQSCFPNPPVASRPARIPFWSRAALFISALAQGRNTIR